MADPTHPTPDALPTPTYDYGIVRRPRLHLAEAKGWTYDADIDADTVRVRRPQVPKPAPTPAAPQTVAATTDPEDPKDPKWKQRLGLSRRPRQREPK